MTKKYIVVPFSFNAQHRYLAAANQVKFLREFHPHQFICSATIEVKGNDRELEFYIVQSELQKFVDVIFAGRNFDFSCEQIAEQILNDCTVKYPGRDITITVSEDGIFKAIVQQDDKK